MIGICHNETHTKYENEEISLETFEYKGCWNCEYFEYGNIFPYYNVGEASEQLGVSKSTIRRWIKKGKLSGRLFIMRDPKFVLGSRKKYFIDKNEVKKMKLLESKRERKTKKQKILLIRGFECLIDESIAFYIQWLNENGFHTSGCCSGDPIDHHTKELDPPYLLFPTRLLTKDKRDLIINTISEINNWNPELKMKYDISDAKFGFRENNVEYKNFLSLSCKYPAGLHLFFHVLKQKSKKRSEKNGKK